MCYFRRFAFEVHHVEEGVREKYVTTTFDCMDQQRPLTFQLVSFQVTHMHSHFTYRNQNANKYVIDIRRSFHIVNIALFSK